MSKTFLPRGGTDLAKFALTSRYQNVLHLCNFNGRTLKTKYERAFRMTGEGIYGGGRLLERERGKKIGLGGVGFMVGNAKKEA